MRSRRYLHHHHSEGNALCLVQKMGAEQVEVLGSKRLTGALLDRLTHRVHILEANGESYRLKQARKRGRRADRTKEK